MGVGCNFSSRICWSHQNWPYESLHGSRWRIFSLGRGFLVSFVCAEVFLVVVSLAVCSFRVFVLIDGPLGNLENSLAGGMDVCGQRCLSSSSSNIHIHNPLLLALILSYPLAQNLQSSVAIIYKLPEGDLKSCYYYYYCHLSNRQQTSLLFLVHIISTRKQTICVIDPFLAAAHILLTASTSRSRTFYDNHTSVAVKTTGSALAAAVLSALHSLSSLVKGRPVPSSSCNQQLPHHRSGDSHTTVATNNAIPCRPIHGPVEPECRPELCRQPTSHRSPSETYTTTPRMIPLTRRRHGNPSLGWSD
ncbi:hypothetical protein K440DRAFT_128560 [Wilcoxina mikolae CBS 423.85]|nr:hypothetical protein K440DRAFT_128560 [Wilcoxina mikolae CBS 423.85]